MTWAKLDDGFPAHPKVIGLSDRAFRAYVHGICYGTRYGTDGRLPSAAIAEWGAKVIDELVDAHLWERNGNGVLIHDYLVYQPSRAQAEAQREAKRVAGAMGAAARYGMPPTRPDPIESKTSSRAPRATVSFDAFWSSFPRKVGKRAARAAFERALKRASAEDISAGAQRYREDPNRSEEFTAHPTTWLNRDGWEDDALPTRHIDPVAEARQRQLEEQRQAKIVQSRRLIDEERNG